MRIKLKSRIIKELIPLIIVIIIAMIILPVAGAPVTNNSALWLSQVNDAMQRQNSGMMLSDLLNSRRPLFLLILASGFKLWGKSVQSASLIVRIIFALQLILIYLLGRIFYGTAVGLLSSGLVATSYGITIAARYIETDIVLPFFILLFIFVYYIALVRSNRIWAVFAGITLGLALMVKISALFCLGLPFGMVLLAPKEKRWEYGKLGLWVIGTVIISLLLLASFMFITNDSSYSMFDVGRILYNRVITKIHGHPGVSYTYLLTTGLPKTIFKYYQGYLNQVTPLSLLMIFGWIFVFIRGLISKKPSDLILTIIVVCFLPFIVGVAEVGERLGQTTMIYMFLYVTLAAFFVSFISLLINFTVKFNNKYKKFKIFKSADSKYPKLISNLLIVLMGFFLIKAQLFNKNGSTWTEWKDASCALRIFNKKPFEVYGRYTNEQQEAAEWLKKNASQNAKIIADGYTNEALDFFEVADYEIPEFHPTQAIHVDTFYTIRKRDDNVRPLFLITYSNFDSGAQRHRSIFPIFEEDIVAALKKENPDYLVISGRGSFFKAYFDKTKWSNLRFANRKVLIYEIHLDRFAPVTFDTVGVNDSIYKHLIWLEKNFPDEYLLFKEKIEILGFTLDELKDSQLRFPRGQIY